MRPGRSRPDGPGPTGSELAAPSAGAQPDAQQREPSGALSDASVQVTVRHTADGREALLAAVASAAGVDASAVRAGRVCPHCGSTAHGRPWATAAGTTFPLSTASTPGVVAVAVVVGAVPAGTEVGVDVERVCRVAAAPLDAFGAGELAGLVDERGRTAAWTVKEAVLKRDGRGLRVDPASVLVDLDGPVATFEGATQHVVVVHLDADLVLAVAAGGLPVVLDVDPAVRPAGG